MVPQSWKINPLKMYKISHKLIILIKKTIKTWTVELTAGGRNLAEAKIQRGIFQGEALSLLLLIITVMPLRWCPRGVMVKAMSCGIVVREFVLQSRYYVHFRANTLGKDMNLLILPPAMGK